VTEQMPAEQLADEGYSLSMTTAPVGSFTQSSYDAAPATSLQEYVGVAEMPTPTGAMRLGTLGASPVTNDIAALQGPSPDALLACTQNWFVPGLSDVDGVAEHWAPAQTSDAA
jgi:hypothetical protein